MIHDSVHEFETMMCKSVRPLIAYPKESIRYIDEDQRHQYESLQSPVPSLPPVC
ncbi:MAG: hypothetical protein WBI82_05215 [Sphaerochaeta sp.]